MMNRNLNIKISVKPKDLVDCLEANKQRHIEDYEKAVNVYWADLRENLAKLTKRAEAEDLADQFVINMAKPVNNTALYDKYIGMFKICTDEAIEISSEDYGCIVDDNWDWATAALALNTSYSRKYSG